MPMGTAPLLSNHGKKKKKKSMNSVLKYGLY